MLKEFKEFAMRGSVVDMAIGIIIGGAFGAIAKSLVSDVLMPPIGLLLSGVDFSNLFLVIKAGKTPAPYPTLADAQAAGAVTFNYGAFINTVLGFVIVAFAAFLVVKSVNALRREQEEVEKTTKECPFCASEISVKAQRCPHCTSQLSE